MSEFTYQIAKGSVIGIVPGTDVFHILEGQRTFIGTVTRTYSILDSLLQGVVVQLYSSLTCSEQYLCALCLDTRNLVYLFEDQYLLQVEPLIAPPTEPDCMQIVINCNEPIYENTQVFDEDHNHIGVVVQEYGDKCQISLKPCRLTERIRSGRHINVSHEHYPFLSQLILRINEPTPIVGPVPETDTELQQELPNGAQRANKGKTRHSLVPADALEQIAIVFTKGAETYGDFNWRSGFPWSSLYNSTQRHLLSFLKGEDSDSESNLLHLAHAASNIMMLLDHQIHNLGVDDRYIYPKD